MKKDILMVVDMQNDFVHGVLGTKEAQDIVMDMKELIEKRRAENNLIIYTLDTHEENTDDTVEEAALPAHCIKGTKGHDIVDELTPLDGDVLMEKRSFADEDLRSKLVKIFVEHDISYDDISSITLVGICTDICVVSNALSLRSSFPFTQIKVKSNYCAGTTPQNHDAALQVMKSCLIDVI